jgi:peptide chain release factor subunit 1
METSDAQKKIDEENKHIEMWKIKRLIKKLDTCRGNGTSVVTLIMPPKKNINDVMKMLTEEIGAA